MEYKAAALGGEEHPEVWIYALGRAIRQLARCGEGGGILGNAGENEP